jgi:hypothetical protein
MVFWNNSYIQTKKAIKMEIIMEKGERKRMVFGGVYTNRQRHGFKNKTQTDMGTQF